MKKFKLILVLSVVLLILVVWVYWNYEKSDGTRAGTLSKLSTKGLIFKTHEGDLFMGMFIGDNAAAAGATNTWQFSVDKSNPEIMKTLQQFVGSGKRATLYYKEYYVTLPWRGDTPYIVYKVEEAPQMSPTTK